MKNLPILLLLICALQACEPSEASEQNENTTKEAVIDSLSPNLETPTDSQTLEMKGEYFIVSADEKKINHIWTRLLKNASYESLMAGIEPYIKLRHKDLPVLVDSKTFTVILPGDDKKTPNDPNPSFQGPQTLLRDFPWLFNYDKEANPKEIEICYLIFEPK